MRIKLINRLIDKFVFRIGVNTQNSQQKIARATLPKFKNNAKGISIALPRRIINPHRIYIGNDASIGPGCLLMAVEEYNGVTPVDDGKYALHQKFTPELIIGNRFTSTGSLQISAHQKVVIEDDVMFAANVFISDGLHGYENALVPYRYQEISKISPVIIKNGSWIGQNVVVLPGVTIGELSIVGANSVVTSDIPDRCIAVGSPARVIKKWNEKNKAWERFVDEK